MEYYRQKSLMIIPYCCILVLLLLGFAECDINQDKQRCANNVVGLAPCLAYVSGESKAPPIDCCTGFKQVLQKSPECVCVLIKDRNDPSLGFSINATLALGLPTMCHVPPNAPSNISDCPTLLHLPPNSPDRKVFEDFANMGKNSNNATAPSASVGNARSPGRTAAAAGANSSNGAKIRKRWLGIETIFGLLITALVHMLPNL